MERNTGTDGFDVGNAGAGAGETTGQSAGMASTGAAGSATATQDQSKLSEIADSARDKAGHLADEARSKASQAREKAGQLKATLADKLEAGAAKLRGASSSDSVTGDGGGYTTSPTDKDVKSRVATTVAEGMDSTANWLRTADLDSLKSGLESQVRNNPARTLLIAAGVGYLLGKAFSGKSD